jgi:hypothetical protein
MWIDLGRIGHKSNALKELFKNEYLITLPENNLETQSDKWVVFIDYALDTERGTKVFTNSFQTESHFYKELTNKLILNYVEATESLDFESDF